jgi:hypothetical protein
MRYALILVLVSVTFGATKSTGIRTSVLERAQVWTSTDISSADLFAGPNGPGAFTPGQTVNCDYIKETLSGHSPKFSCRLDDGDRVKVKYGGTNGEVYGELMATRLLWALGFGADRMYSVNVICRGCPRDLGGIARPRDEQRFAPAVVERKMAGGEWSGEGGSGWSWSELDLTDASAGGATLEQRDALKLLAVLMQHTDSKPEQQRIVCLGQKHDDRSSCDHPFLMINDLGMTFGRANRSNADPPGSVDLAEWRKVPVWRDSTGCVGNLPRSFSGTLDNPVISEEGRRFLASLLARLSDKQLHDLFDAARVDVRLREPGHALSGFPTIDEWVDAFKDKRQQIESRHCA